MSLLLLFKQGEATNYIRTGSGTIVTSGAASFNPVFIYDRTASGTATTSGNANPKYIAAPAAPTGGAVLSGTADPDYIATPAIGGIAIASNGANPAAIYSPPVSGGAVLSGGSNPKLISSILVSGGATTSGTGSGFGVFAPATPTGSIVLSGNADGTYIPAGGGATYNRTGSGTVTISGTASFEFVPVTLSAGHGGPVRFARNSYKGPDQKAKSLDDINKVADLLRVVPKYDAPTTPPLVTVVDSVAYISFEGRAKISKATALQKNAATISIFGESQPVQQLTPRIARPNGFKGSAHVSFHADFDDDDIASIAAWLLQAS